MRSGRADTTVRTNWKRLAAALVIALGACDDENDKSMAMSAADAGPDSGTVDAAGIDAAVLPAKAAWTQYGYDLANSQAQPGGGALSKTSVAGLGERYRVLVGGGATSTPVLADGVVYFGAWDGFLYAVDAGSGQLRWKVQIGSQFVRGTATIEGDRLYVGADGTLFAVSRSDGAKIWERKLTEHPQGYLESSPKLADGVLIIGVASYELNLMKPDYTFDGNIVGVDAQSGELLWRQFVTGTTPGPCMGGSGVSVWSSAAVDPALGLAYIGTGQTYEQPASTCNDSIVAIHYKKDHVGDRFAWKATYTVDDVYVAAGGGLGGKDHDVGGAPNLFKAGDVDAVGAGDKSGTYRAFNRKTGAELWRAQLKAGMLAQLGGVMTTAAVSADTIYVGSNQWMAFGFISTGTHNPADVSTLHALDTKNGMERWRVDLDAPMMGALALRNGVLYHPTIRGTIYARDALTGQELWKAETGTAVGSGINVSDDALYVSGGFTLSAKTSSAMMVAYTLNAPALPMQIDMREQRYKELTVAQCQQSLTTLQPDAACRTCLCECDASRTGSCQTGCWGQAACIVANCAAADFNQAAGAACYADHCTSKLLPPNVLQESVGTAPCVQKCATVCNFK